MFTHTHIIIKGIFGVKSQAWRHIPVILAIRRLKQEDQHKLEVSMGYTDLVSKQQTNSKGWSEPHRR